MEEQISIKACLGQQMLVPILCVMTCSLRELVNLDFIFHFLFPAIYFPGLRGLTHKEEAP